MSDSSSVLSFPNERVVDAHSMILDGEPEISIASQESSSIGEFDRRLIAIPVRERLLIRFSYLRLSIRCIRGRTIDATESVQTSFDPSDHEFASRFIAMKRALVDRLCIILGRCDETSYRYVPSHTALNRLLLIDVSNSTIFSHCSF